MAGDWIKFELATLDKPEVCQLSDMAGIDIDSVIGKLLRVWAWFDQQTQNGNAPSVTKKLLDRIVSVTGFCAHMESVGWMVDMDGLISLPHFDRHNGETGKKRAVTAKRVGKHRNKSNDECNATVVTKSVPREEKRREENKELPPLSPKGAKGKPKRSIPDPFLVTPEMRTWAAESVAAVNLTRETENFVDYWRGAGTSKADWTATWRTWMRKAQTDSERGGGRGGYKPINQQQVVEDNNARVVREIEERERNRASRVVEPGLFDLGEPITIEGEVVHAH